MSDKITTPGAILLKHTMPTEEVKNRFDIYTPLDKKGVKKIVTDLLSHGGPNAVEHINSLAKLFFNTATYSGASTPLQDYINDSDERKALIDEFEHKVRQITSTVKDKKQLNAQLTELTAQYNDKISKQNLQYLLSRGSMAAKMAKTEARGNPTQLATGTSTPLMSSNVKQELIPLVIKRSFAQGMSPAEHIALSYMGRSSTVMSQLSTSLPGALFKRLSPTVFHEVITMPDCGTKNGIDISVEDKKSLLGRYTAEYNSLITEPALKQFSMSGKKTVRARSPMTCEAHEGVCQHCFGLMANGRLPEIGTNVGVIAAQSVSEVLTQSMLSTKHKSTVGERKGNSYDQASNILRNPSESFKDEATISTIDGVVTAIKKAPLGDNIVFVNEQGFFSPSSQSLIVKIGDKVRSGQPLSDGVINPRKLVALRGLGAGREYMSKELRNIYGSNLDPRHFEIISKNLIKYVEIDDPGHTGLLPGDKVEINHIRKYLDKNAKVVPIHSAEGSLLAKPVLALTPGTLLDHNHVHDLENAGIKEVHISPSGLKVKPLVPGLETAKMLDKNWLSKLSFSRLRDSIKESAATYSDTHVHSTDPIAAYTFGTEFGEGKDGKY